MIQGKKSWLKFKILKWCLASLGLVLSSYLAINYYQNQNQRFEDSMNLKAERAVARIESRLKIYETLISQTQAFFITLQNVNYKNFHNYYENLQNLSRFHGIKGLGFTKYVHQNDLLLFLERMRKEIPGYKIWPFEKKEEYFPLVYLEPGDKNSKALGFDQSSEEKRNIALQSALLTGETTMTGKLKFMREARSTQSKEGFILFRPLFFNNKYKNKKPSIDNKNLVGFVFAPFTYQLFFDKVLEDFQDDFIFKVYENGSRKEEFLIYTSLEIADNDFEIQKEVHLFGQDIHLFFYPKAINRNITEIALLIFTLGFSFTLLVMKVLNDTIKRAEQSSINESYLEESLRARDEFISIASHELKTPLTSLKLRAQLSKRKLKHNHVTDKDIRDFSTEIEKQVDRLERLVNDILDISRIRTGSFSLQPENYNLSQHIEEVIIRMAPQFNSSNYPITTIPKNIMVYWDKLRIEQVLNNLLVNAIKYGQNTPIKIEVQDKKNEITLSVTDNGMGIDPKFRDSIFNRFERAGISPNEISGLGLGLYITYQIVTSHKGKIWVDSVLGEGSTFTFKMPKYPRF